MLNPAPKTQDVKTIVPPLVPDATPSARSSNEEAKIRSVTANDPYVLAIVIVLAVAFLYFLYSISR